MNRARYEGNRVAPVSSDVDDAVHPGKCSLQRSDGPDFGLAREEGIMTL
ncbi:MAG: hypothetical protein ABW003_10620 [Microvirga sp.]